MRALPSLGRSRRTSPSRIFSGTILPILAILAVGPIAAACAYKPEPTDFINIDDSPTDIRACKKLGRVSEPVPTAYTFERQIDAMKAATLALGGTDLLLTRRFRRDWSYVEGTAYRCSTSGRVVVGLPPTTVIRVRY